MQLRIARFSWVYTSFLFDKYDRERTFMCMAVHMLAKSKMALTTGNVNTFQQRHSREYAGKTHLNIINERSHDFIWQNSPCD